ncbi:RHS repeat-associated core domain-containing protein [Luteibacter yeojuensis]
MFDPTLHARTPGLTAIDPRGLSVRLVAYHRLDPASDPESRIERNTYDAAGRARAHWDARLWADGGEGGAPNQSTAYSLAGHALRADSVDAGWSMALFDDAGRARRGWDGRGTRRTMAYDGQLRPMSVHERLDGGPDQCVERFTYGGAAETEANRCGRMIRHDDPAGSRFFPGYALPGGSLAETQWFLVDLAAPDWPEAMAGRDVLLENDGQGLAVLHTSRWYHDAQGAVSRQADAAGNVRHTWLDVAGQPVGVGFQRAGAVALLALVHDMAYDACGQVVAETAGNGMVTLSNWSAVDGRLQRLQAIRSTHLLQDLAYTSDPAGNVTRIEDGAHPTDWFDGSQVDAVNTYAYDTLYQLIEATGRESVRAGIGPGMPGLILPGGGDASRQRNYAQFYSYDAGGNLLTLRHTASDLTQYTRTMAVAKRSNRSLFESADGPPPDIAAGFDANGNQCMLEGQVLRWDARNQLQHVTQVVRIDEASDGETYVYGGGGMRQRKRRTILAKAVAHAEEVRYLPGLELRRNSATGEILEVAIASAGSSVVRWLHWQANGRKALPTPQLRYSLDDHLGSGTLELDDAAGVISHEGYYPFGGTAWWAARSEVDASYKTHRYSGKERDASGLYYYGYRYYAPWLCRWINPDPGGNVDGTNLYRMVGNNPVTLSDAWGNYGTVDHGGVPLDALDLHNYDSGDTVLRGMQRTFERRLRSDPRDLAPFDIDKLVDLPYRPGTGAYAAWSKFSTITQRIIDEATANKQEKLGPRKSELGKLTAHAGYHVHATGELHAGFVNLLAPLSAGKTANVFPGVTMLPGAKFKATTTEALVGAIEQSYTASPTRYGALKNISSARAREAPNPLHAQVKSSIKSHIERTTAFRGGMMEARSGVPGMHAEVQAYNHALNAGLLPHEFSIFTEKLDKSVEAPKSFPACYNCASLIPPTVSVITERKDAWPTQWYRLTNRHRIAAGQGTSTAGPGS